MPAVKIGVTGTMESFRPFQWGKKCVCVTSEQTIRRSVRRIGRTPTNAVWAAWCNHGKFIMSEQGQTGGGIGGNPYLAPCILNLDCCAPEASLNDLTHFEDWQVHCDYHPADQRTQNHHDDRFHQAGYSCNCIIHFGLRRNRPPCRAWHPAIRPPHRLQPFAIPCSGIPRCPAWRQSNRCRR